MLIEPIQENLFSLKLIDSYTKNWHSAYPWFKRHEDQLKWTQQWERSSGKTGGMDGISNRFKLKQVGFVLRGKEWLAIRRQNRYPKRMLLQLFGRVSSFWIICSHFNALHWKRSFLARKHCYMPVLNVSSQLSASHEWSQPVVTTCSHFQAKKSCCSLLRGLLDTFSWISHFPLLPASVSKGHCLKVFGRWQF